MSTRPTRDIARSAAPPSRPLAKAALLGVAWNSAGSIVLVIAQLASTAATARLVSPREFGLYATAQAATGIAGYFTLTALGSGIQRRSRLGSGTVGTALLLSLASSLAVAGVLFFGAGAWARLWGLPEADSAIRLIALALGLTSAATVPIALAQRQLRFRATAVIETVSAVIAMGAGVALAAHAHSAEALAGGQVLGAGVLLLAAAALSAGHRPTFDPADARELATFAGQVSGLGFAGYVTNTAPSWFVARAFGSFDLGIYSRAYFIVSIPATYAVMSIYKVLYPIYGRVRDDIARTKVVIDEALTLTTGIVWPIFALLAGASPVIVAVLLGPRWDTADSLLPLLALGACANIPSGLLTNAAEAMGWMRRVAVRQFILFIGVGATLFVAYLANLDLIWILVGIAIAQWTTYLLTLASFLREGLVDGRSTLRVQATHASLALVAYAASAIAVRATANASLDLQVAVLAVLGATVAAGLALLRQRFPAGRVLWSRLVGGDPASGPIQRTGIGGSPQ